MTTRELLIAARALIERPENWQQGHLYGDGHVRTDNFEALRIGPKCFCAEGALTKASFGIADGSAAVFCRALRALSKAIDGDMVHEFNDTHTHAEVLAMFDRAIAASEET